MPASVARLGNNEMKCAPACSPARARCGWDCSATSTETRESAPRLNEDAEDEYLLPLVEEAHRRGYGNQFMSALLRGE